MTVKFAILCEMEERWVQPFISLLKTMESDGQRGHSEIVGLYADGDGDFQPKFIVKGAKVEKFSPPYPDAKYYPEQLIFDADWKPEDIDKFLENRNNRKDGEAVRVVQRLKDDGWNNRPMKL